MWTVKKHPNTGAIWIEDAHGQTVCDMYHHTAHAATGIQLYPNAEDNAARIVSLRAVYMQQIARRAAAINKEAD